MEAEMGSEEAQRELERLEQACGAERLPPVLERAAHQRKLAQRAEPPRVGEPCGTGVCPLALPHSELADADAVALSAQVRTVADRNDLALLAEELTRRSSDPLVRARAIFRWVADAVAFDASADELPPQDAASVLRRRTAAGDGHARLVEALAQHANLRVSCVYGHGRSRSWRFAGAPEEDPDTMPPVNHCWNALYAGNCWRLLDAAWASGSVSSDGQFHKAFNATYWLPPPEVLAVTHKPVLQGWQLLAEPISHEQYRRAVPRGAAFFRHGLELLSHPADGTIRCGQRLAIRLGHAPHVQVHFACVLVEELVDEEAVASDGWPHDCCLLETHESWTCIHITAPPQTEQSTGRWELRVMVAPGAGLGGYVEDTYRSMEWCVSYRLDFGRCAGTPLPSRFPYVARGATVIAPTSRGIERGSIRFRVRWGGPATPSTVSVVVPGAVTATHLGLLEAVPTTIAGEKQYCGVIEVEDSGANVVQVQAEFETATGTKTVCLAEYCVFIAQPLDAIPGRELRTRGLRDQYENMSRPVPDDAPTPRVQSWEQEQSTQRRPPVDSLALKTRKDIHSDSTDVDFSPETGCLFSDVALLRETVREHIVDQWMRVAWSEMQVVPGQMVSGVSGLDTQYAIGDRDPEPLFATDSDSAWRNITGGFLGDCAFLSCLTVLSEDMRLIRRIFVSMDEFASTRAFVTRFCKRGEAVEVVVDGAMPVLQYAEVSGPLPAFCHASDCLWPALLQKAYAKLRGSYQQTLGDSPSFILQALTGGPSVVHPLTEDEDALEDTWEMLLYAMQKSYVVCACATEQTGVNLQTKQESHAYAILQVRDIAELDQQLVMLRNPLEHGWDEMGAAAAPTMLQDNPLKKKDDPERWPPELCQALGVESNLQPVRNGVFWVNLKDMHRFFESIVVNKSSGRLHYHSSTSRLDCTASVGGGTAFFLVELDELSIGDAVVTVTQHGLSTDTSEFPPIGFSVWSLSTGKEIGAVGPTAAESTLLECSFDKAGEYYVIVDLVNNQDVSQQVVLGVATAGAPVLSAVPENVPLGGGMHKIVAKNGRTAEGFYDRDSYFKHGLGSVSMTSWGMWSPAHLRYWRFIVHENKEDHARMSEFLHFELENMELLQEAEPWVSVELEPKQRRMIVVQSVGQASSTLKFQVLSRKLQLENPGDAVSSTGLELQDLPVVDQEPLESLQQSDIDQGQSSISTNDASKTDITQLQAESDAKHTATQAHLEERLQSEYELLEAEGAANYREHQREARDRKHLQDARAEEAGLALELMRRETERDKLQEAAMGNTSPRMVIPRTPNSHPPPIKRPDTEVSDTMPNISYSIQGRQARGPPQPAAKARRATYEADPARRTAPTTKRESLTRSRAQRNEDRIESSLNKVNPKRAHVRMRQNENGDSWEQAGDLAKREAERILRREHDRKEKQRKDREMRTHLRRQKQLEVLQMKASMNLNHWEEMTAQIEAVNDSRAKAAAARYTAQQKMKVQRDEFQRKKKALLEERRRQDEQAKRKKWHDSERRRKDALSRKEADAKAKAPSVDNVRSANKVTRRAAAMKNLKERLRNFFNVADSNADGAILRSDLAKFLKGDDSFVALLEDAGMEPLFVFRQLDVDGDGMITLLEFLKIMDAHSAENQHLKSRTSVLDSLTRVASAGDVAVLSNNTMELRMRMLAEDQTRKEAKERETRAADIARQIAKEDANQRMRQSMLDFDNQRKEEFAKIEANATERRRVLVDKQRTYQKRLREMKQRQSSRTEPFFLTATGTALPKPGSTPGQRYVCERDTPIRESILSERSLRLELHGMNLVLLKKRAAAAGVATDKLSSAEIIDHLLKRNKVRTLRIGDEVVALDERIDEDDILQIRTTHGWIARECKNGTANLRPANLTWLPTGVNVPPKQKEQAREQRQVHNARRRDSRQSTALYQEHGRDTYQEGFVDINADSTPYQVEFSTGDTGDIVGDMYLRLQGSLGSSKTVLCSNVAWQHYERDSRCSFVFQAPWLGQIKSVAVGHNVGDNTHDRSTRLLLSNVVVKHVETGTVWRFPCQQWLDDVSRMCVIPEAGSAVSDGGHNAARSISYAGARVAFTPEEEQKLHRVTVRLRAIAPETTSVPVAVEFEGSKRGQDHVKTVQLSLQIPDTTYATVVEAVGKFQCASFGPLRACTIRDITGVCCGLGSKVHVYVDCVMVEVEGTSSSWYFDCHQWLDSRAGTMVESGPAPRGLEAARLVHPSKRGLVEQSRDMKVDSTLMPALGHVSENHGATWRDIAEWTANLEHSREEVTETTAHQGSDAVPPSFGKVSPAATAAAAAAIDAGQIPSASEGELLQHHANYLAGHSLVDGEDMVYVVRVLTGSAEAAKALRQTFRSAPPTVALTLFGTHGPPMIVDVPITFIPYSEERFVVRVQQYHGVLQGVRIRIDDTIPGAPALPFKWDLLSLTITDIRRMQTWHSTCRSVFECTNSVTAALLRPTATGRSAAHRVTLVLGLGTEETSQQSRMQVFISGVGGEGSASLIALPVIDRDCTLSTRAVLQCPEAWLPCLGDHLELGLCLCDDAAPKASEYVSHAIIIRDGVEIRFRFERSISPGAVHYGTPVNMPQEADVLKLDGGKVPADSLRADPTPLAEFLLRLHYIETCLYSSIECWIGYWELEPNSSKFAVAWTPTLRVTTDAAYYAPRESYEFPLRLPSPGAELWGIKIKAQGSSWGIGFVELVDQASREVYSCNCDGSPLMREEVVDGSKCVSRELVFATKQPLEPVSRDPTISPWEEWKQDQLRRAEAAAEKERRAAGHRGALEMGLGFARSASQAMQTVRARREEKERQVAEAREREAQCAREQALRDKQIEEATRREQERQEAEMRAIQDAEAARLRVEAAERAVANKLTPEEQTLDRNLEMVMEATQRKFSERECVDALDMEMGNVADAIRRIESTGTLL